MDGFHEQSNQRKATSLIPVSCAFQKIAVVPVRHPCRIVTKTKHPVCFTAILFQCSGARRVQE